MIAILKHGYSGDNLLKVLFHGGHLVVASLAAVHEYPILSR